MLRSRLRLFRLFREKVLKFGTGMLSSFNFSKTFYSTLPTSPLKRIHLFVRIKDLFYLALINVGTKEMNSVQIFFFFIFCKLEPGPDLQTGFGQNVPAPQHCSR